MPGLRYAAGRLGSGSDVLGFDDAMSRDHDWGCRLTLLVDEGDRAAVPQVSLLLERELPESYQGLPVRFPLTWDPAVSHKVEIATAAGSQLRRDLAVVVSAEALFTLIDLRGLNPEQAIASATRTARTLTIAAAAG